MPFSIGRLKGAIMALTGKQRRFVDEYLIDLNATQAAIRAGYSPKRADQIGYENLRKPEVSNYLSERQKELSERTEITADRVLKELAKIGFADIRSAVKWGPNLGLVDTDDGVIMTNGALLIDSDTIDDDTAASISEVSQTAQGIKLKMHDKQAALVSIGRHLGMFNDKLNVGGQGNNPLVVEIVRFTDAPTQ
jgi:phage terminase small subunit